MGAESLGAPPSERTPTAKVVEPSAPAPRRLAFGALFRPKASPPEKGSAPDAADGTSTAGAYAGAFGEPCRWLLPAALFLATFVSVMAMLFVYMENTAMGRQQFRQIMRQEDELANVAQDDERLVEFIAQRLLVSAAHPFPPHAKHASAAPPHPIDPTPVEQYVAQRLNNKRDGVFVELGAYGLDVGESSRTEWLEGGLGWRGLLVTPDARDYFRLRERRKAADTLTAQACISTSTHPKEITYQESGFRDEVGVVGIGALGGAGEEFSARVKCFPLYTFLLASREPLVDFLSISCDGCEYSALKYLPTDGKVRISIVEVVGTQAEGLPELMSSRGYTVSKKFPGSTVYASRSVPS